LLPRAHALSARLAVRRGRFAAAVDSARTAVALLDRLGAVDSGESLVRLVLAEALDASGDRAAALIAIARAHTALLERAGQIAKLEWRSSFLDNIPEHARTIQLAEEWLVAG
ncbi:MAG: hypothetical protein AAGC55_01830, partial [Myxococcota bacterium]